MKLWVDGFSELSHVLGPEGTVYYDFGALDLDPEAVYVVGREQLRLHSDQVRAWTAQTRVIFSNPAEGSVTLTWHCHRYGVADLVQSGQLGLITGGAMPPGWPGLRWEHFLTQPLRFPENRQACANLAAAHPDRPRPHTFLFLNGRARPHRRELIDQFGQQGLLAQALWSNLDSGSGPVQRLPEAYEVPRYAARPVAQDQGLIKHQLFDGEWGEIYIHWPAYRDTVFSVVTETVWDDPWSFFTEKIARCLAIGQPFVAAANPGFLRDLRALGFQTFDGIIDESYDSVVPGTERIEAIVRTVQQILAQDPRDFLRACEPRCKYNQQHMRHLHSTLAQTWLPSFYQYASSL